MINRDRSQVKLYRFKEKSIKIIKYHYSKSQIMKFWHKFKNISANCSNIMTYYQRKIILIKKR